MYGSSSFDAKGVRPPTPVIKSEARQEGKKEQIFGDHKKVIQNNKFAYFVN